MCLVWAYIRHVLKATAAEPAWGGLVSEGVVRVKNTLYDPIQTSENLETKQYARARTQVPAGARPGHLYGAHPSRKVGRQKRTRRPKRNEPASRARRERLKSAQDDELRPRGRKTVSK